MSASLTFDREGFAGTRGGQAGLGPGQRRRSRRAQGRADQPSVVHQLSLFAVWLAVAVSGVVFSEPAPTDALTMGLIILLPTIGLVSVRPLLVLYIALWLVVAAGGYVATTFSDDLVRSTRFTTVSLYLCIASFVFAAFIVKRPQVHLNLILNAWTVAAVIAATAGLIGYFSLLPGSEIFTKFGRATGTFKDPNVFGPFLVVPMLYMLHLVLTKPFSRVGLPLMVSAILVLATLLSFSRGAWFNMVVAIAGYGLLAFITAPTLMQRERIVGLLVLGIAGFAALIAVVIQFDAVGDLLAERASLSQSYDVGPEGRFAGQLKALVLAAENPLGIGSQRFAYVHHSEDVHNVYISVFLNNGWLGGAVYVLLTLLTLCLGFMHLTKAGPMRPLFIVLYAAFAAVVLEGLIIDTDHWRSFYLTMGLLWGLMAAGPRAGAENKAARFGGR